MLDIDSVKLNNEINAILINLNIILYHVFPLNTYGYLQFH